MASDLTGETVELLQTLIRNQCVNEGTAESGFETRNADVLQSYVEGAGVDIERWEPTPGRASFVARIPGTDPDAPSLCMMGHTDVVPVNPAGWRHDPFGGELIDGEVWGRGAVDMLNLTASMAVVFRSLVQRGFRPEGRPPVLRRRRRGGGQRPRCAMGRRRARRRDPLRLRADRERRPPSRQRGQSQHRRDRRREGCGVATAAAARHAGPRLDAVRLGQRAREGGQGRDAASPSIGPRRASTSCGAGRWRRSGSTTT